MKRFSMFRWDAFMEFHRYNVDNFWTNASRDARIMFWLLIGISDLLYYPMTFVSFVIGIFFKT